MTRTEKYKHIHARLRHYKYKHQSDLGSFINHIRDNAEFEEYLCRIKEQVTNYKHAIK